MDMLKNVTLHEPLPIGSVVIGNLFGTGVNVITTTQMEETDE